MAEVETIFLEVVEAQVGQEPHREDRPLKKVGFVEVVQEGDASAWKGVVVVGDQSVDALEEVVAVVGFV